MTDRSDQRQYGALRWRNIGPHRGGRVSAVAAHPTDRMTFYFGACAGGVWKTESGGNIWHNVSDGYFGTASVGALAVAATDPNVVIAGTGEANIRGNVTFGDGVYATTDGGESWTHLGLAGTRHISRIRIDPRDEKRFYVAALGRVFGPNRERGVYRTEDGGTTFEQVLFVDEDSGAIDLSMDPLNPRVLYAAMWHARRQPHSLTSGGPGSGLYKSKDGGSTWVDITAAPGFPEGPLGRIGVSASGARSGRVYALVEAKAGGMFVSDDAGRSWTRVSDNPSLRSRAWYYTTVVSHPHEPDTVYALNNFMWKSTDGGKTYLPVATPHPDHHDLWIDPADPARMIQGNDGGACISYDRGDTWSTIYNQPTGEFYHVETDTAYPYRVYGAQQDNTTLCVPSRSDNLGITSREWYDVGGAESGYIAVRSDDPNIVFAGSSGGGEGGRITRFDRRTSQRRDVSVWPERTAGMAAEDYTIRFQWTSPIVLSPHDPSVLYSAGNYLFRSVDEGGSWEKISPDLTRDDKERQAPSGGPITKDHTGVEVYCTIFSVAESPVARGLIWVGTDDGLVHVTSDGGTTWKDVTPPDLPEWSLISMIEASPHDAQTAYIAATRYRLDDTKPYAFKTSDGGATWEDIGDGIGDEDYLRVIREDPVCPGLLYAGTERGPYVSLDDGRTWEPLLLNLPVVAVHDLKVHGDDLVAATHGRAFWILDDVTPLRQLRSEPAAGEFRLFTPPDVVRIHCDGMLLFPKEQEFRAPVSVIELPAGQSHYLEEKPKPGEAPCLLDCGQNPPSGVAVQYFLTRTPSEAVVLRFEDAEGHEIRSFSSAEGSEDGKAAAPTLPVAEGPNRFLWDLRYPEAVRRDEDGEGGDAAPLAPPGRYKVTLTVGGERQEASFRVLRDPRVAATDDDLAEQFRFLVRTRDLLSEVHVALRAVRRATTEVEAVKPPGEASEELEHRREEVVQLLRGVEAELTQVNVKSPQDEVGYPPKLDAQLKHLFEVASSADAAPTQQAREALELLASSTAGILERARAAGSKLDELSARLSELNVGPITPLRPEVAEGATARR